MDLRLENLALSHQIGGLQRSVKKPPKFTSTYRRFRNERLQFRLTVLRKHCVQAALAEMCQILPGATVAFGAGLGIGLAASLHRLPAAVAIIGAMLVFVLGVGAVRESASQWLYLRDKLTARLN